MAKAWFNGWDGVRSGFDLRENVKISRSLRPGKEHPGLRSLEMTDSAGRGSRRWGEDPPPARFMKAGSRPARQGFHALRRGFNPPDRTRRNPRQE